MASALASSLALAVGILSIILLSAVSAQQVVYTSGTNLGLCNCDLTTLICDVGCCCDTTCSTAQIAYWNATMGCLPSGQVLSDVAQHLCTNRAAVQRSNFAGAFWLDDRLCIVRNNHPNSNYYYAAPSVDVYSGAALAAQLSASTNDALAQPPVSFLASTYLPGAPLAAITSDTTTGPLRSFLALPAGTGAGGACDDSAAAGFLVDAETECVRTVSIATACDALSGVPFLALGVLPNPGGSSQQAVSLAAVRCYASAAVGAAQVACPPAPAGSLPALAWSSPGVCTNALLGVAYTVTYSDALQVTAVSAVVSLALSVTGPIVAVPQAYSVAFMPAAAALLTAPPRAKSGNPGYARGEPVLAGIASADGTAITAAPLNILGGGAGGLCTAAAMSPLVFGRAMLSGCALPVAASAYSNCVGLAGATLAALGVPPANTVIGKWGASDPAFVSDWFALEVTSADVSTATGSNGVCANVPIGLDYEFLVTPLGALSNPQRKLVGGRAVVATGSVAYWCAGGACAASVVTAGGATAPLSLQTSVRFVEAASVPPQLVTPRNPNLLPSLPDDVFYPFRIDGYSSGGAVAAPALAVVLAAALAAIACALQ